MVDGEDNMIIMNGQQPFLLCFEPLSFFKCTALGAMSILAGLIKELPTLALRASLQDTTEGRGAASDDGVHRLGLLIRKPIGAFVLPDMLAENISDFIIGALGDYTVRIWRELYLGSSSFASMVLTMA